MRALRGGSIVTGVPNRNRLTRHGAVLGAVLYTLAQLAGCASPHAQQKPAATAPDQTALTVSAEVALKHGDCRSASEDYAQAAQSGDAALARRAAQVAVACEHVPAAWQSAQRWRALAPDDVGANTLYAAVALKLYRTSDARDAIRSIKSVVERDAAAHAPPAKAADAAPVAAAAAPAPGPRAGAPAADPLAVNMSQLAAVLLEEADAPAVLTAMSEALAPPPPLTAPLLLLLGELALAAYDGPHAEGYAQQALALNANDLAALHVLARACLLQGRSAEALSAARRAQSVDPLRGGLERAEVLAALNRYEEARQQLEELRSQGAAAADIDRRLALLAFDSGDLKDARTRFRQLISSGEGNDGAQLYLADIQARDGDSDGAIAAYRRLYDSSVALSARSRAAGLLLERNSRTEALDLLDDYAADHPEQELDLTLAKARLLADHGDANGGLTVLKSELDRHPQHPSIEYDRAVILEQAGRVHESVAALEQLLTQRPDDPTILNALGYTLADHSLELPQAEALIRRALIVMPDSPAALDSLGWVRFRAGDAPAAARTLAHAWSVGHDAEIAAHLGEALWVSGEPSEARKVWATALAREPDSKPLKATVKRFVPDAQ
jgi:tetratricopeptide (TPR) repeat protein